MSLSLCSWISSAEDYFRPPPGADPWDAPLVLAGLIYDAPQGARVWCGPDRLYHFRKDGDGWVRALYVPGAWVEVEVDRPPRHLWPSGPGCVPIVDPDFYDATPPGLEDPAARAYGWRTIVGRALGWGEDDRHLHDLARLPAVIAKIRGLLDEGADDENE